MISASVHSTARDSHSRVCCPSAVLTAGCTGDHSGDEDMSKITECGQVPFSPPFLNKLTELVVVLPMFRIRQSTCAHEGFAMELWFPKFPTVHMLVLQFICLHVNSSAFRSKGGGLHHLHVLELTRWEIH